MAQKNYYTILGVQKNATEDDIKKAYRRLAHQHHPDKKGGNADRFKQINEAYQVLSNKDKRQQYDQFGRVFDGGSPGSSQGSNGPFGGSPFGFNIDFDPSSFENMGEAGEIFDAFFEGLGIRRKRRTYERGADLELRLTISLEEAFRGATKTISVGHFSTCAACNGLGHNPKEGVAQCVACNGQGEVRETRRGFFGNSIHVKSCAKCNGIGNIPNKPCMVCASAGRVKRQESISIGIAPGIDNGQIIKMAKAGDIGARGAEAGDLYIHIAVAGNASFRREGINLITKKEISLINILLNKKMEVAGVGGEIHTVELPHDVSANEPIRIVGGGMPRLNSRARGDLFVELIIKKPKKLSEQAKEILEGLRREIDN